MSLIPLNENGIYPVCKTPEKDPEKAFQNEEELMAYLEQRKRDLENNAREDIMYENDILSLQAVKQQKIDERPIIEAEILEITNLLNQNV